MARPPWPFLTLLGAVAIAAAVSGWGYDPAGWRLTAGGEELPTAARESAPLAADRHRDTAWSTTRPMRAGDTLAVDLGPTLAVGRVRLDVGPDRRCYPRGLKLATSLDGREWTTVTGLDQLLSDEGHLVLTFTPRRARHLRLTNQGTAPGLAWEVGEVYVWGE